MMKMKMMMMMMLRTLLMIVMINLAVSSEDARHKETLNQNTNLFT